MPWFRSSPLHGASRYTSLPSEGVRVSYTNHESEAWLVCMYKVLRSASVKALVIKAPVPSTRHAIYNSKLNSAVSYFSSSSGHQPPRKTGQHISSGRTYPREWTKCMAKPKYKTMASLESLNFNNLALQALPVDPQDENYVRQVSGACFSRVQPTPVENPVTVAYSVPAMALLDMPEEELEREDFSEYLSGNKVFKGAEPAAHCYCGHQFGNFAGQLGDGATMYLGEVVNKKKERWEIQFKGAGLTPYSRSADGRKVLRSSIREFLCSEAMHHLGIPTTRAGSCVTSDSMVIRDIYYTGNPIHERATIILRIAETFIRFGSFEIFKETDPMTGRRGPSVGRNDIREQLLNYVVQTFYPEIWERHTEDKTLAYLDFCREIVKRTANLVAEWQCVGWCHGVLNTDNMSIVGLTIDYGPYGFMDAFDRGYICNGSDDGGRYAYDQQPDICKWNLQKLTEALAPLISKEEALPILATYNGHFENFYIEKMRKKLGVLTIPRADVSDLVTSFLDMLEKTGADFTNSFRSLSRVPLPGGEDREKQKAQVTDYFLSQCCTVEELRKINEPKMDPRQIQMFMMLAQVNPDLLQQFGRSATALVKEMERIEKTKELKSLTQEKKRANDLELWNSWLEKYEAKLQLEVNGVDDLDKYRQERVSLMNNNNPRFILRNYIAQNAIKAAEDGDFSEVQRVLKLLEQPYSDAGEVTSMEKPTNDGASTSTQEEVAGASASCSKSAASTNSLGEGYDSKAPIWAADVVVT